MQLEVSQLSVGDLVWKNRDPALEGQLRSTYEGKAASELRKTHVQVCIVDTAPTSCVACWRHALLVCGFASQDGSLKANMHMCITLCE